MFTRFLILFLTCYCASGLIASPTDDLGSLSQETRDAAAKTLRSSHATPSGRDWEAFVGTITNGMTKTDVEKILSPFNVTLWQERDNISESGNYWCRLDAGWNMSFHFNRTNHMLEGRNLTIADAWVEPPAHYTGNWIVYYLNGQKSQEIHYEDGLRQGESITFRIDGSKDAVKQYVHGVADGPYVNYSVSGRTNQSGLYKAGRMVMVLLYGEDGTLTRAVTNIGSGKWTPMPMP